VLLLLEEALLLDLELVLDLELKAILDYPMQHQWRTLKKD
jgi:hypothetical protein